MNKLYYNKNIKSFLKISDIFSVYITTILGITLYFFSSTLLYPIGYFYQIIAYLIFLSIVGILLVYNIPKIAKGLFIANVIGTSLVILFYILTTSQDWTKFIFIFTLLILACLILLIPVYLLREIK